MVLEPKGVLDTFTDTNDEHTSGSELSAKERAFVKKVAAGGQGKRGELGRGGDNKVELEELEAQYRRERQKQISDYKARAARGQAQDFDWLRKLPK